MSEPSGRELDALIAQRLFGYRWYRSPYGGRFLATPEIAREYGGVPADGTEPEHSDALRCVPRYSSDLADAWQVVQWLLRHHFAVRIEMNSGVGVRLVQVWSNETHPAGQWVLQGLAGDAMRPEQLAEAICRAALVALGPQSSR